MKKDRRKMIFMLALLILSSEVVFFVAFLVWALTEKVGK
jgi:hypothetical protein